MQTFRAYLLNDRDKIVSGEWIEAADADEALARAKARRREGAPRVEIWCGPRKLLAGRCGE